LYVKRLRKENTSGENTLNENTSNENTSNENTSKINFQSIAMGNLLSFNCQFFATQNIGGAKELVVFLRLSGSI